MNKPATQPKTAPSEKDGSGVFKKVTTALKRWYDLFMGRPSYRKPEFQGSSGVKREKKSLSPEEDSVTKDIRNVFGFFGKVFGKATIKIQPSTQKIGKGSAQAAARVAGHGFFTKVVRLSVIIFFLMLIAFIGVRIYSILQNNGENGAATVYISPTPVPYKPSKPSVYAEDEFILDLEEKLRALEREIAGINIRETTLTPPILDFDINFDN